MRLDRSHRSGWRRHRCSRTESGGRPRKHKKGEAEQGLGGKSRAAELAGSTAGVDDKSRRERLDGEARVVCGTGCERTGEGQSVGKDAMTKPTDVPLLVEATAYRPSLMVGTIVEIEPRGASERHVGWLGLNRQSLHRHRLPLRLHPPRSKHPSSTLR